MVARRSGGPLSLAAAVVAVAAVAAAGAMLASLATAGESPLCDDSGVATVAPGEAAQSCVEPAPPTETTTETQTVEEPPVEPTTSLPTVTTETTDTTEAPGTLPADTATTVTRPAPTPAAAPAARPETTTTTVADPKPAKEAPAARGAGVFGSSTWGGGPPDNGTPTLSGGPYVFPVVGTSSFGDSWGAARATVSWHHGVDIFAPLGAPIVAVADGVLFSVGWNKIGGRRLWLRDREGNYFYFAHLSGFSDVAADGAQVRAGTVVGYVGNTGDAEGTPYHLHFEIHPVSLLELGYDGAVDPFSYVSSWRRFDRVPIPGGVGEGPSAPAGPPPGAILIGFTDIASVERLSSRSLQETLEQTEAAAPATVAATPPANAPVEAAAAPPPEEHARIARSLDSEASEPPRDAPGAGVWDALASCESGGNWGARTGNGYVGGLQFLPQTWASGGGGAFAPSPHLATREQQIVVAERVLELQGWRAWPVCSALLGIRRAPGD